MPNNIPEPTIPEPRIQDNEEDSELFAAALNLEDQFYTEGYDLGVADGSRAGLSEGRIFGLEKGFEKFVEMGRLGGRTAVWRARVAASSPSSNATAAPGLTPGSVAAGTGYEVVGVGSRMEGTKAHAVPLPPVSDRLLRQLKRLGEATDQRTLVMENSEEGVDEFDERLREAKGKAAMIARALGEREEIEVVEEDADGEAKEAAPKQAGARKIRIKDNSNKAAGGAREMEDFAGLPGSRR